MSRKSQIDPNIARRMFEDGASLSDISKRFSVSRAAIWRAWNRIGFKSDKYRIDRQCHMCGKALRIRRQMALRSTHSYCSKACYINHVKANGEGYKEHRQGQRRARKEVAKYFNLLPGMVVHHVDKDSRHNNIGNLWVFASHAEHMSYHRGGQGKPTFKGDQLDSVA